MSQPRERPILMSAPMVRALLAGTKAQTRRAMKPQPEPWEANPAILQWRDDHFFPDLPKHRAMCPYGVPGDRLWVRETHATLLAPNGKPLRTVYRADGDLNRDTLSGAKWTPGIHMHRHDSRLTLEITDVRVERLQEISEADAMAEGIGRYDNGTFGLNDPGACMGTTAVVAFMRLWESINGAGSWDANPWVWAISFRRIGDA